MGRPRKWESDAERKRAERGASSAVVSGDVPSPAGADEGVVRDPPPQDGPDLGTVEWEGKLWPIVRPSYVSEDDFVHAEVEMTKTLIERGLKDHDGQRVARAEAYARWRYRGWLVGEIVNL